MDILTLALAKKYAEQLAMGDVDTAALVTAEVEKAMANLELLKQEDIDKAIEGIEMPSLEGLATEEYVNKAIDAYEIDLSGYTTDKEFEELKANAVFKILDDGSNDFGLLVLAAEGKSLYQSMGEQGPGLYTAYVQKGVEDNPAGEASSCRGICSVDTYYAPDSYYGWAILFDSDGNCYTRYISVNTGVSEWNNVKQQDLSSYAKTSDLKNYQPKGEYLTEHQQLKTINGESIVGEGNIDLISAIIAALPIYNGEVISE